MISRLKNKPKSKIIKKGYINLYSKLSPQEKKYHLFNSLYKKTRPEWDNTLISLLSLFKDKSVKKDRVLDLGCGNGNYLIDECRDQISWAEGVDFKKSSVVNNVCLDKITIADVGKMPFANGSFDVAMSLWVFEHLSSPESCFKEVQRVLKKGGSFFFCTPNKKYFLVLIKGLLEKLRIDRYLSRRLYGREEEFIFATRYLANDLPGLAKMLKKAGFSKVEIWENFDPGYTSFNNFSFAITKLLGRMEKVFNLGIFRAHLVGRAVK